MRERLVDKVENFLSGEGIGYEPQSPPSNLNAGVPLEGLDELHIVKGAPLDCDFIFVVAFRNQAAKIERCLSSIIDLPINADLTFGLAVIDDDSSDRSLEICLARPSTAGFPHVIVHNRERKCYTRNLNNAVHLLVTREDTVVIKADGDDFFPRENILAILRKHYDGGALRTFGSFLASGALAKIGKKRPMSALAPWDLDLCNCWMHLKTFRKSLF